MARARRAKGHAAAAQGFRHRAFGTHAGVRVQGANHDGIQSGRVAMHDHDSPQQARIPHTRGGWLMTLSTSDRSLVEPVVRRLSALRPLSTEARALLEYAMLEGLQRAGAGEDLISEGD